MTTLNIGNEAINSEDLVPKVQADITFLADRLQRLQQQRNPNPVVLETYKNMLESRRAVLDWLLQDSNDSKKVSNA